MLMSIYGIAAAAILMWVLAGVANVKAEETENAGVGSEQCLVCHGGTTGPLIRPEGSHAFGVVYESSRQARRHLRNENSKSGFGATIAEDLLVNGRVECTSCHIRHEEFCENQYRLRTPTITALCVVCHDMRNARATPSAAAAAGT